MNTKYPAETITWRDVESTNVAAIGWDRGRRLYVQYKSSAVYLYPGVSRQRAVACARAKSVGAYVAAHIKPHYEAIKVIDGFRVKL